MRWSSRFEVCVVCKQSSAPHMARGQCKKCYLKAYRESPENQERIASAKREWHLKQPKLLAKMAREEREFAGQRDTVLDRDGHRCTRCSTKESLVVHHKDGNGRGKWEKNNVMSNLLTLCRSCHAREHATCGRWARAFDCCTLCRTIESPHNAKGLCRNCYIRLHYKKSKTG